MKRYVLRSKVKFADLSKERGVWAAWDSDGDDQHQADELERAGWIRDTRARGMGWRLISDLDGDREAVGNSFAHIFTNTRIVVPASLPADAQRVDESHYHLHRILLGVPEGVSDLVPGVSLPLESNLDYMGGSQSRFCALSPCFNLVD
jgi:folate-binding Fe-S cluster repair protein YgfZ